ncbi:MAG TPA: PIN domain-containing protein [Candidatus Dojkabacteria bacterium]|nr:PIN domain-containing protein [Candidatus Dojkabacteria bacterium]
MKRIFLDANIIIDLIEGRQLEDSGANKLKEKFPNAEIYISSLSVHIVFHILRIKAKSKTHKKVLEFFDFVDILSLTSQTILHASKTRYSDFEDTLQYLMALNADCNYILTRDKKDFEKIKKVIPSKIKIVTNISQIK